MTRVQLNRNGQDARDLMAVLLSNAEALRKQVSQLYGDVDRLHRRIKATHRVADRLHRKIRGAHSRIRIFRSQSRVRRHRQSSLVLASR